MALIKLGGGVTGMSGSIGGTTFARNASGAYARARTIPVNRKTAAQVKIRAIMSQLKTAWLALSAAERTGWATYAANVAMTNRLGETVYLSGFNQFCRSNGALLYQGAAIVEAAPTIFTLGEQDPTMSITSVGSTGVVTVSFDDGLGWCAEVGGYMLLQQSAPQNPTVNFFAGPWVTAGKVAGAVVPIASPHTFTSAFTLAAGKKVWVQARIMRADGRLSAPFRSYCLCS